MLIAFVFGFALVAGAATIWEGLNYFSIDKIFFGLALMVLSFGVPVYVGYGVRGEEETTIMLLLGDWLRGALHLQSQAMAWLKESTGF